MVIFGTGGLGKIMYSYLTHDSEYEVAAYTVHGAYVQNDRQFDLPVVPFDRVLDRYPPDDYSMLVAVGYQRVNQARAELYHECKRLGYTLISYVSSKASYWGEAPVGDNCIILEFNAIQPLARIGSDVVMFSGNLIGHGVTVGDHCLLAAHAVISGDTRLGPYCFVGSNATVKDGLNIAPRSVIGAGAVVLKDTVEGGIYAATNTPRADIPLHKLKGFAEQVPASDPIRTD